MLKKLADKLIDKISTGLVFVCVLSAILIPVLILSILSQM